MTKSIGSRPARKASKSAKAAEVSTDTRPAKPYDGFPLFPHRSGRWAKKIQQRTRFFGRWAHVKDGKLVPVEDVDASARDALNEFNRQWPYLADGRTPPPANAGPDACTMRALCNAFWRAKRAKLLAGDLSPRSFAQYEETTDLLVAHFGKDRRVDDLRPDDFASLRSALAERLGTHALKNTINRCRIVLKFAWDNRLIPAPVTYGQSFDRPSAKAMRKARNEAGLRLFEADEIRRILDAADPVMKAAILLGVNCGFGNTDVASLPQSAVNLDAGWIDFPRPKTEIGRRVPLWQETVSALREAIAVRPKASDPSDSGLCFLTRNGSRWVRVKEHGKQADKIVHLDALTQKLAKLLKQLHINGRRGLGFYTLRHVFETVGGESKDQVAVNAIMGHVDSSMAGQYRERISDERLKAVTETVRQWLFGSEGV